MFPNVGDVEKTTVQYHDIMNPAVWDTMELKPDVSAALLKVAQAFIESWKIDIPIKDIILTGSNANYNWTQFSDFDLHIVVDIHAIPKQYQEFVIALLKSKKTLFNSQHHIRIKGYSVEVYAQDVNDVLYATGVYSLTNKRWVKEPMLLRPEFEHPAIQARANDILQNIDNAIDLKDEPKLRDLLDQIAQIRKTALAAGGEFDTENLVFKVLRNSGAIEKLRDVLNTMYDKNLTLEQLGHDNEWGRPELTRKMLAVTPGQINTKGRYIKQLWKTFREFIENISLDEGLTSAGRYKKRRAMIRNRYKLVNARKTINRHISGINRLNKRTHSSSLRAYYHSVLRGRKRSSLSSGEKSRLETLLKRKYIKSNVFRKGSNTTAKSRQIQAKRVHD